MRASSELFLLARGECTFWSFPLKEQPGGQQQQGPLTGNIVPDMDDSSDDSDDESSWGLSVL